MTGVLDRMFGERFVELERRVSVLEAESCGIRAVDDGRERTLGDLPVGTEFEFGSFGGRRAVWTVGGHNLYVAGATAVVSRDLLAQLCFDAREPGNEDFSRREYGNNFWRHSNIRRWMNSFRSAGTWYEPQHDADEPPAEGLCWGGAYERFVPGFLSEWDDDEVSSLVEVERAVPCWEDEPCCSGGVDRVRDRTFLLTSAEVGLDAERAAGPRWPLFTGDESRFARYACGEKGWWWLADASSSLGHYVRRVGTDGTLLDNGANGGFGGVRLACNLISAIPLSMLGM